MFDAIDERPCGVDFVPPCEEGGIADHRIEDEAFVGFGAWAPEARAVVEIHFDGFEAELRSGPF